jgi:hypothetical protein
MHQKTPTTDLTFRSHVAQNVDGVVKKAEIMACRLERENVSNAEKSSRKLLSNLSSKGKRKCAGHGCPECRQPNFPSNKSSESGADDGVLASLVLNTY